MSGKRGTEWGEHVAQLAGIAGVAAVMLSMWPGWGWIVGVFSKTEAAGWAQAIGSAGAIVGVWWQTNKQLADARAFRKIEEDEKSKIITKRAIFLLGQCRVACGIVKTSRGKFYSSRKSYIHVRDIASQSGMLHSSDDIPLETFGKYKNILNSVVDNLSGFPYWEVDDYELANDIVSISNLAIHCIYVLDYEPYLFGEVFDGLLGKLQSAEKNLQKYAVVQ